jgi:orotate phosphoribosyltransferase
MPSIRHELLRLLAHKSFKLGDFKLSSGATSDYYIDCRTTTAPNSPDRFSSKKSTSAAGRPKPSAASPWAPTPSS